jgi:hypothetical protein
MRTSFKTVVGASLVGGAAVLMASMGPVEAQRRGGRDNAALGLPVSTGAVLEDPDAYYGKLVTVSAGVDQVLSKTAFVIDQWKAVGPKSVQAIGKPILVIAPYLTTSLAHAQYLMMRGQIVKFDPAAIARVAGDYSLDLGADAGAKYAGQPVLVATSVVNSVSAELGRKPMMPEELSMSEAMKTINASFAALRTAAQESKADAIAQNTARLAPAFKQTETIWDNLGQSPAGEWAREAQSHTASIARAAGTGDWEAVKTATAALNSTCASCHGVYRERQDDGVFRFKAGSY